MSHMTKLKITGIIVQKKKNVCNLFRLGKKHRLKGDIVDGGKEMQWRR